MKRINILLTLFIFSAGLFSTAHAQRRGVEGGDKENRQANIPQARVERSPQRSFNSSPGIARMNSGNNSAARIESRNNERVNSFQERSNNRPSINTYQNDRVITANSNATSRITPNANTRNSDIRNSIQRDRPVAMESQGNNANSRVFQQSSGRADQQRTYDRNSARENNNSRYNSYRDNNYSRGNSYRNYNYNANYYYRSGYNRRIYFMSGTRYSYRPYNSISLYFGGYPYYYSNGLFYDYYSGYYQPIFPPFGIRVSTLPFGFSRIYIGVNPFYYYNGIFYRQYDNSYEVVDAPIGATVTSLPGGAKSVLINGETFYELNGTYFKEERNSQGAIVYVVVGKNGEINNSVGSNNDYSDQSMKNLNNGDIVGQLPEGSKVVTIDGQKLYVTPDDTYLKEESDGNTVQYRVMGK